MEMSAAIRAIGGMRLTIKFAFGHCVRRNEALVDD
jgi:hypothetical protein